MSVEHNSQPFYIKHKIDVENLKKVLQQDSNQSPNYSLSQEIFELKHLSWSKDDQKPISLKDYVYSTNSTLAAKLGLLGQHVSTPIARTFELNSEELRNLILSDVEPSDERINTCEFGQISNNELIIDLKNDGDKALSVMFNYIFMTEFIRSLVDSGKITAVHRPDNREDWIRTILDNT